MRVSTRPNAQSQTQKKSRFRKSVVSISGDVLVLFVRVNELSDHGYRGWAMLQGFAFRGFFTDRRVCSSVGWRYIRITEDCELSKI